MARRTESRPFPGVRALALALLAGTPLAACDCSTDPPVVELVTIDSFELGEISPPAVQLDGLLRVVPGATVELSWAISGPVGRVVLAANDLVLVELGPEGATGQYTDDCAAGPCGTGVPGDLLYTLTVIGTGQGATSDTRSLLLSVGEAPGPVAIVDFTADATTVDPGDDVTLHWETNGAATVSLEASPPAGGAARSLGEFGAADPAQPLAPSADSGLIVDRAVQGSWRYTLTATSAGGQTATAELLVVLRGDAFLTALTVTPERVHAGEPATLAWESTGLGSLVISRDDGGPAITDLAAAELTAGSRQVTVTATTTFTLSGVSLDGAVIDELCTAAGCAPAEVTLTLRPPPAILSFTADDGELSAGGSTFLRWSATEADALTLTWTDAVGPQSAQLTPLPAGSLAVNPADSTTYTLTATSPGATDVVAQVEVGVRPAVTLAVPAEGFAGELVTVSWTATGATGVTLLAGGAPVPTGAAVDSGSVQLQLPPDAQEGSTLHFELSAVDSEQPPRQSSAATADLVLHRHSTLDGAAFSPAVIARGDPATLSWDSTDATRVQLSPPAPSRDPALLRPYRSLDPATDQLLVIPAGGTADLPLPFPWPGPGGFTLVRVGEDGTLAFGGATPGAVPGPLTAQLGEAVVAVLWDDLAQDPADSELLVHLDSTAGARELVIEWRHFRRAGGDDADDLTFEVALREDGHVQLSWQSLSLASGAGEAANATVGVATDAALTWASGAPRAFAAGEQLLFATGPLPGDGALEVAPRAPYAPQLVALAVAGPEASLSPPPLDVLPYAIAAATTSYVSLASRGSSTLLSPAPGGDEGTAGVALPFPFPFFDVARATVTATTNGYLSFDGGAAAPAPAAFPDPAAPDAVIAVLWDDLTAGASGALRSEVIPAGAVPGLAEDAVLIEWAGFGFPAALGGTAADDLTFEVALLAGGDLELHWSSLSSAATVGADPRAGGAAAAVGLEDGTGSSAVVHSFRAAGALTPGDSVRFDYRP